MSSTPLPAGLPSRTRLLIILGALSAFGPLCFDMYLPALPRLAADLDASEAGAQLSLSLCMLGLGLGQVVVGPLSDQIGRRVPLLVGVVLFSLSCLACAFAPNLPLLLVARLLAGLGGGAGAVIARSMVRDLFSGKEAAHAFGVTALVFGIAPVIAPLLGSLLTDSIGWRGIFVVIGVCGLVMLVVAARLPETLPPEQRHDAGLTSLFSAFPEVLRDRAFLMPALVLGIGFLPLNLYLSMSSFVLQDSYGMSAQGFGYMFAVNSVGIWLAGRFNLRLIRSVPTYRLLTVSVLCGLVGSALVAVAAVAHAPLLWLLVPLFFAMSAVGPLMPNGTTLALEKQAGAIGAASACLGLVQTIFSSTVSPLVSAVVGVSPTIMGVSMVVAGLLAVVPLLLVPADARRF